MLSFLIHLPKNKKKILIHFKTHYLSPSLNVLSRIMSLISGCLCCSSLRCSLTLRAKSLKYCSYSSEYCFISTSLGMSSSPNYENEGFFEISPFPSTKYLITLFNSSNTFFGLGVGTEIPDFSSFNPLNSYNMYFYISGKSFSYIIFLTLANISCGGIFFFSISSTIFLKFL